jgi:hypothetical protein
MIINAPAATDEQHRHADAVDRVGEMPGRCL